MKIPMHLLLLALCVLAARVSAQPTPGGATPFPQSSDFDSESDLSEAGETAAEAAEDAALPIGGTTEPEMDSDSSSSEEEPIDTNEVETPDGTDVPDLDQTTLAPLGGIVGAGNNAINAYGNNENAAGESSGAVLGMKASNQAVSASGFSATAVGVATTLGIVGALAAAAGIILYIKKK